MPALLLLIAACGVLTSLAFLGLVNVAGYGPDVIDLIMALYLLTVPTLMNWKKANFVNDHHWWATLVLLMPLPAGFYFGWASLLIFIAASWFALWIFVLEYGLYREIRWSMVLSLAAALFGASAIPRMMAHNGGEDVTSVALVIAGSIVASLAFLWASRQEFGFFTKMVGTSRPHRM